MVKEVRTWENYKWNDGGLLGIQISKGRFLSLMAADMEGDTLVGLKEDRQMAV